MSEELISGYTVECFLVIKTQPFNFEIERLEIEPTLAKAEWSSDLSHDIMQYYLFYNIKGAETSRMKMTEENSIVLEGLIPDAEYDLIIEGGDSDLKKMKFDRFEFWKNCLNPI